MSYQTVITEDSEYLRVEITGDRTPGNEESDAIEALSQVADVCHKKGFKRIMMISALSGDLPTMAAFNVAKDPEKYGWSRHFKLASVNLSEKSKAKILFAETVAANRGFGLFKVFDNEKDAKAWLFES